MVLAQVRNSFLNIFLKISFRLEFKKQCVGLRFVQASKDIGRPVNVMSNRWYSVIQPTLSEHLFCGLRSESRRLDVLKFILHSKSKSSGEIDMTKINEKWPFLSRKAVNNFLTGKVMDNSLGKNMPLYKKIEIYLNTPNAGTRSTPKNIFQRRLDIVHAFDELRKEQMQENLSRAILKDV